MSIKQRILGITPVWAQQLMPLRRIRGWKELFEDIASDKLSKNGTVLCETHLIFIAGLPKSGTTWLEQLLANTRGWVQLNKSCLRSFPGSVQLLHEHDADERMLTCAPKNKLSFLKLHLNPYPRNFSILDKLGIKTVVLIRDLRDMLISRYHHVVSQQSHWDHKRLMSIPESSRLLESMKGVRPADAISVIDYYDSWVSGWMDRLGADQTHSIAIKYEEMSA
ncbi:MAG: sulfotransferase domain-containing protein, partial [bacterium]|nr:sulfotransferase domain-containing protein [bacterium]